MKLVELGRVTKPHGLTGELRVYPHFAEGEVLLDSEQLLLWQDGQPPRSFTAQRVRRSGKLVLLKLQGVDDRDAAEALRGAAIGLPRDELPEPPPGEYYLCDLIGMQVVAPDGEIGVVEEVRLHPSVDAVVVRTEAGTLVEQPLAPPWLEEVDLEARRLVLASREGLFE